LAQWNVDVSAELEKAVDEILRDPAPDPTMENWNALATVAMRENAS
ncbi:MAG: hypothetical protein K0Q55_3870, partial [Verrucomicrobia bacterium]|nr:hypothetical protein [Verrucomicrobiota bacterium]